MSENEFLRSVVKSRYCSIFREIVLKKGYVNVAFESQNLKGFKKTQELPLLLLLFIAC